MLFNIVFWTSYHEAKIKPEIKTNINKEIAKRGGRLDYWSASIHSSTPHVHDNNSLGHLIFFGQWNVGNVTPDVRIPEREERKPPRQCNSQKGKFIADSSQGSCRIQCSGAGSESPEPKLLHKFIGWAHAVGSWFKWIGYKFAQQFHWSNTLKTFTRGGLSQGFLPRS